MTREDIVDSIRTLSRQYNVKPITDTAINTTIERAMDDLSNKCPFCIAIDRGNSVIGQQEYPIAKDILEVIEVFYVSASGSLLATTITDTDLTVVASSDISGFPTSGTLQIGNEKMTYSSYVAATKTFTITARGTESTTAVAHTAGVGIVEAGVLPVRLSSTSVRRLGDADESWIGADSGDPTSFYVFPGVVGFDIPTDRAGYHNIIIRSFVRPPALTTDTSTIQGLIETFYSCIINYSVAKVLQMLAQDQQTLIQSNSFMSDYNSGLVDFRKNKHLYVRGDFAQVVPYTGR